MIISVLVTDDVDPGRMFSGQEVGVFVVEFGGDPANVIDTK